MARTDKIFQTKQLRLAAKIKVLAECIDMIAPGMDEWRIDMLLMAIGGESLDRPIKVSDPWEVSK